MRLTTRVRYGARALVDIAQYSDRGPVPLRDIAGRQGLSQAYLEQLILTLKAAGLVRSVRGSRGGFVLAKDATQVTMAQVVEVLGGELNIADCVSCPESCKRAGQCAMRPVWEGVNRAICDVLVGTTLADLVSRARKPGFD